MSRKRAAEQDRELGTRLRADRKAADLTQLQLAEILDVKQQQISKYELGKDRVARATLTEMARIFGKAPEAYLGNLAADDAVSRELTEPPSPEYTPEISTPAEIDKSDLARLRELDPEDRVRARRYVEALLRRRSISTRR